MNRHVEMHITPVLPSIEMLYASTIPRLIVVGDLTLDMLKQRARRDTKRLMLSAQLFQLLVFFSVRLSSGKFTTYSEISYWLYGSDHSRTRAVEMALSRLRMELAAVKSVVSLETSRKIDNKATGFRLAIKEFAQSETKTPE